jgi:hypothetical protein
MEQNATREDVTLAAFRLSEERACARYLEARRATVASAGRFASLNQLVAENPKRVDYRRARDNAVTTYKAAVERTRLAWLSWQRAQLRSDGAWTVTKGRNPRVLAVRDEEAA